MRFEGVFKDELLREVEPRGDTSFTLTPQYRIMLKHRFVQQTDITDYLEGIFKRSSDN